MLCFVNTLLGTVNSGIRSLSGNTLSSLVNNSVDDRFDGSLVHCRSGLGSRGTLSTCGHRHRLVDSSTSLRGRNVLGTNCGATFNSGNSMVSTNSSRVSSINRDNVNGGVPGSFRSVLSTATMRSGTGITSSRSHLLSGRTRKRDVSGSCGTTGTVTSLDGGTTGAHSTGTGTRLGRVGTGLRGG